MGGKLHLQFVVTWRLWQNTMHLPIRSWSLPEPTTNQHHTSPSDHITKKKLDIINRKKKKKNNNIRFKIERIYSYAQWSKHLQETTMNGKKYWSRHRRHVEMRDEEHDIVNNCSIELEQYWQKNNGTEHPWTYERAGMSGLRCECMRTISFLTSVRSMSLLLNSLHHSCLSHILFRSDESKEYGW